MSLCGPQHLPTLPFTPWERWGSREAEVPLATNHGALAPGCHRHRVTVNALQSSV